MKKILIMLICLLLLTGCSNNSVDDSSKEKLTSEIEYISLQIADLLHNLNNLSLENYEVVSEIITMSEESGSQGGSSQASSGSSTSSSQSGQGSSGEQSEQGNSQSSQEGGKQNISVTEMQRNSVLNVDTEDVDWDTMKQNVELINTSWSIILIDLNNNNISTEDITAFSKLLNETIISIKNEDKDTALTNLTSLYSYVPKFLTAISADKHTQNIEETKYQVFLAYSAVSQEDWDTVTTKLTDAENTFLSIVNNLEYSKNNKFKVKKTHTLIKDLQNAIPNNDKELFFLKYKNLMESLNTL